MALDNEGVGTIAIDDVTGFPEMMDGRVKTLHPNIHGGLLARRDLDSHLQAAKENQIELIDLVVVNLYPLKKPFSSQVWSMRTQWKILTSVGPLCCALRLKIMPA